MHIEIEQPALWTQEQAVSFEAARECITDMMAICTSHIDDAEIAGDRAAVETYTKTLQTLAVERASLTVPNQALNDKVRAVYGAQIRAYRAGMTALQHAA